MRRPAEFTAIRPLMPPNPALHVVPGQNRPPGQNLSRTCPDVRVPVFASPGVPRPQPPPGAMPYIELRHRAPENRLRLPFPPPAPPEPDGMEEHLEGEDSAVKDLEDVEVKDLVDLNLNLDPEDGRRRQDAAQRPEPLSLQRWLRLLQVKKTWICTWTTSC